MTHPFIGRPSIALALAVFAFSGCATASSQPSASSVSAPFVSEGQRTRVYKARSLIFTATPSPGVSEKRFKAEVEINIHADIKSYKFKNDFGGDPKANTVAQIAFSGSSAGFGVYDRAGAKLAEYTNGRASGPVATFEIKTQGGTANIRWLFGSDYAVSIIESVNTDGRLGYSEVTTYTAQ